MFTTLIFCYKEILIGKNFVKTDIKNNLCENDEI